MFPTGIERSPVQHRVALAQIAGDRRGLLQEEGGSPQASTLVVHLKERLVGEVGVVAVYCVHELELPVGVVAVLVDAGPGVDLRFG